MSKVFTALIALKCNTNTRAGARLPESPADKSRVMRTADLLRRFCRSRIRLLPRHDFRSHKVEFQLLLGGRARKYGVDPFPDVSRHAMHKSSLRLSALGAEV